MIYHNGYLKKEMRHAESKAGFRRRLAFGLFLGLFSFALYFALQTLQESVIKEAAPQILQRSFFSTITIYLYVSFLFLTGYLMIYFDTLFFSEIRRNAWYLLIKMGYRPIVMIASKLAAQSYTVCMMYIYGFAATAVLTVFIKAPFVYAYMPSLFAAGLVDLLLITVFCMVVSLFVRKADNARYLIVLAATLLMLLKSALGMNKVISDRVAMQSLQSFVQGSVYLPVTFSLILLGTLVCVIRARSLSKYVSAVSDADTLPDGVAIGYADARSGQIKPAGAKNLLRRHRPIDMAVTLLLILFIGAALLLNIFIILISTATPGSEVTIRGVIPYVFASDTMEPALMKNDLVYFKRIDSDYQLIEEDIVLLKYHDAVYVERISQIAGDELTVDIDQYPPESQRGAMLKTVARETVYGVYIGRNRWLGALILFANNIIGRIVFLMVPAVLLFFRKRFKKVVSGQKTK
jgi:signal peptidase I